MNIQSGPSGGSAPEPTAPSRVMAWSPTAGWTVQRVNPDQAKQQRRQVPTVTACTLAGDRHRKRPVESGAAVAGPSKRRRTMGPPGPLPTAHGKKTHQHRPQAVAHISAAATATTTEITVGNNNNNNDNKSKHTKTSTVTTTARKRPLAMAVATSSTRSTPEPAPAACRRLFAQTPPRQWKRVRTLGCGTFGCVREVIHPKTGDRAAIKEMGLLPNDYRGSRDGALGDAFRPGISPPSIHMAFRELAAVAALSGHPSVAPVRDAYLAMPRTGAGAGVSSGIECALLMDLMDGHLGRVVRFLAGHGDARPRSTSAAASLFDSAPSSSRLTTEATSSSSSSSSTTTSSSLALSATSSSASSLPFSSSSSSLVSSLFSSAGPLCPASTSPSSSTTSVASSSSSSSSSSTSSSSSSSSSPLVSASPLRARDMSSVSCQTARGHSTTSVPLASNVPSNKSAACPFALRVHVARLVARDILPALVFMHERLGMAHRDIKPNNILYSGDMASGALRFRLADFGLARFVREPRRDALARRRRSKRRHRDASDPSQNHTEPGDTSTPLTSSSCPSTAVEHLASTTAETLDQDNGGATDATEPKRPKKKARANAREKGDNKDGNDNNDDGNKNNGKAGSRLGPCFTANVVTHLYKPPELLLHYATRRATERGLAYGCSVDMWSFGVVLMEVLAGGHLTPSEPEETLVKRVRGVFRLDGPPRPHLVRDLVCAMEARAATGRSGIGSIPRVPSQATTDARVSVNGTQESCPPAAREDADDCSLPPPSSSPHYDDLIDLVERLLCVDPLQRMTATEAMRHPFVTTNSEDDAGSADLVGLSSASEPRPRFLGACEYKALGAESSRAAERARAGDPTLTTCTLGARKVAVARACAFADRYDLKTHTVACAVAMLDHYLERAASCNDEAILLTSAGALLVACSLYECRWPSYDQFVSLGVVPPAWYGVDRRAPSAAVRTPAPDAVLRAAVDLFNTLDHLTPHVDAVTPLIDGSLAIGRERKDMSPWRAMTATFSRYPPSLTLSR